MRLWKFGDSDLFKGPDGEIVDAGRVGEAEVLRLQDSVGALEFCGAWIPPSEEFPEESCYRLGPEEWRGSEALVRSPDVGHRHCFGRGGRYCLLVR